MLHAALTWGGLTSAGMGKLLAGSGSRWRYALATVGVILFW